MYQSLIWPLIQLIHTHLWTPWMENHPNRTHPVPRNQPIPLTPTTTATRSVSFIYLTCSLTFSHSPTMTVHHVLYWEKAVSVRGCSRCCVGTAEQEKGFLAAFATPVLTTGWRMTHTHVNTHSHKLCKVVHMTHTKPHIQRWSFLFPLMSHCCDAWPGVTVPAGGH